MRMERREMPDLWVIPGMDRVYGVSVVDTDLEEGRGM
jgi:hypothetical protein